MQPSKLTADLQRRACRGLVWEVPPEQVWELRKRGLPIDEAGAMIVVDCYGDKQPARVIEPPKHEFDRPLVELFRGRLN